MPEGGTLPPNTIAELRRDMTRLRLVCEQIEEIETERLRKLERVRKTMIVALARKLLIELWRLVTTGILPAGVVLHKAP